MCFHELNSKEVLQITFTCSGHLLHIYFGNPREGATGVHVVHQEGVKDWK